MADSLEELRQRISAFVEERDWVQFHTPKNLAMAMIVEAAELVEHFQWSTPQESQQLTPEKREAVSHELADTFVYLLRIAEVLHIDLIEAANQKIELNAKKYPVEKARGSNAKYTEYL
ncbi:MAG: nucleotide pyrophosphohydrolase [Methylotenera sp.]|uniref:nucleotide pyrophosphohydrolase n=1 Tax=Methylotenera sp. TaxID=2051956 RepID=UPI00271DC043|nr:nucleotide pyrophosphohydrolase [Methylotenera sp.]MDO9205359.1 nucleotide pyrophosphohydrolase [Methylotenera sp.]MDO9393946.1 nucleotide pyrophosphohydrolase [Methylotenera sp.]MDP1523120.1 nucleotide pyrophosphohydrolase [Methylotenera sp.]MDP3307529.1 nucleotide pyrophosphohydrolase [Methylotenera sp.]MDP3819405.1 nucleotide pyrophosphohydrolase [Methylotenera sp.]